MGPKRRGGPRKQKKSAAKWAALENEPAEPEPKPTNSSPRVVGPGSIQADDLNESVISLVSNDAKLSSSFLVLENIFTPGSAKNLSSSSLHDSSEKQSNEDSGSAVVDCNTQPSTSLETSQLDVSRVLFGIDDVNEFEGADVDRGEMSSCEQDEAISGKMKKKKTKNVKTKKVSKGAKTKKLNVDTAIVDSEINDAWCISPVSGQKEETLILRRQRKTSAEVNTPGIINTGDNTVIETKLSNVAVEVQQIDTEVEGQQIDAAVEVQQIDSNTAVEVLQIVTAVEVLQIDTPEKQTIKRVTRSTRNRAKVNENVKGAEISTESSIETSKTANVAVARKTRKKTKLNKVEEIKTVESSESSDVSNIPADASKERESETMISSEDNRLPEEFDDPPVAGFLPEITKLKDLIFIKSDGSNRVATSLVSEEHTVSAAMSSKNVDSVEIRSTSNKDVKTEQIGTKTEECYKIDKDEKLEDGLFEGKEFSVVVSNDNQVVGKSLTMPAELPLSTLSSLYSPSKTEIGVSVESKVASSAVKQELEPNSFQVSSLHNDDSHDTNMETAPSIEPTKSDKILHVPSSCDSMKTTDSTSYLTVKSMSVQKAAENVDAERVINVSASQREDKTKESNNMTPSKYVNVFSLFVEKEPVKPDLKVSSPVESCRKRDPTQHEPETVAVEEVPLKKRRLRGLDVQDQAKVADSDGFIVPKAPDVFVVPKVPEGFVTSKAPEIMAFDGNESGRALKVVQLPGKSNTSDVKMCQSAPVIKKKIGGHVLFSDGFQNAVSVASKAGFTAFAIFLKDQRTWLSEPIAADEARKFETALKEKGFDPHSIIPHGSYLLNCGATDPVILKKSRESLVDELNRCRSLGLPLFNFHPGSYCSPDSEDVCIARIVESINYAHSCVDKVITVVENTSGKENIIGGTFLQLKRILNGVDDKSRVGICLDTCHAFASGYDLRSASGYMSMMAEFDDVIGLGYLRAIHINDSKDDLGSHLDHHSSIGRGKMGLACFKEIMNDPRLENIPLILETPIAHQKDDLKCLESLIH